MIEALARAIGRHVRTNGLHRKTIPALDLIRRTTTSEWAPALYELALFVLARRSKEVEVGGVIHRYDPRPLRARIRRAALAVPGVQRVGGVSLPGTADADRSADGRRAAHGERACRECRRGVVTEWVVTPGEPELQAAVMR
jgi:hypothetical protein